MGSISAVHNSFFKIKSSIAQNPTAQNSGLCPLSTARALIRRYVQLFSADARLRAHIHAAMILKDASMRPSEYQQPFDFKDIL